MSKHDDDMRAELERLRAENARLKARGQSNLGLKIGDKGGISVTGMGRFPTTLYVEQWERLIAFVPQIEAFIAENRDRLARKGEEYKPRPALQAGETRTASGAVLGGANEPVANGVAH